MASLKKFQIINELYIKHGIKIKNVRQLNIVLQEMGIHEHIGGFWHTTAKGLVYSIYSSDQVLNADLWHEAIVDAIAKFLKCK